MEISDFTPNFKIVYERDLFPNQQILQETDFLNPFTGNKLGTLYPGEKPAYVQKAILLAENAIELFLFWGFKKPSTQSHIEIRLLDLSKIYTEKPPGFTSYMENFSELQFNLSDSDLIISLTHEIFHQIQYEYYRPTNENTTDLEAVFFEGTATLIADLVVGSGKTDQLAYITQFEGVSLLKVKPPHAAAFFWRYLCRRFNVNTGREEKAAFLRMLLETIQAEGNGQLRFFEIQKACSKLPWFGSFDQANYYNADQFKTFSSKENYWSYFALYFFKQYAKMGNTSFATPLRVASEDHRFKFIQEEFFTQSGTTPVIQFTDGLTTQTINIPAYTLQIFELNPNRKISCTSDKQLYFSYLDLITQPTDNADAAIYDFKFEFGNTLKFSTSKAFDQTNRLHLFYLGVITTDEELEIQTTVDELENQVSDAHITNWNAPKAKNYEVNPLGFQWTFLSPDVLIENPGKGKKIRYNTTNQLKVRVRNTESFPLSNVKVRLHYQPISTYINANNWLPFKKQDGTLLEPSGISLAPYEEKWITVQDWYPTSEFVTNQQQAWLSLKVVLFDENQDSIQSKVALHSYVVFERYWFQKLNFINLNLTYHSQYGFGELKIANRGQKYTLDLETPPQNAFYTRDLLAESGYVLPVPNAQQELTFRLRTDATNLTAWDGGNKAYFQPSDFYFPITDNSTLPENVNKANLISIYQLVDHKIVGGMTIEVVEIGFFSWVIRKFNQFIQLFASFFRGK